LTALGSVEGWAEVGRGALESCGGGEGGEGCDGEGRKLHFEVLVALIGIDGVEEIGCCLELMVLRGLDVVS